MEKYQIAIQFGQTLDNDNFQEAAKVISANCKYIIGDKVLIGPVEICASYESNMIEGRRKLDKLEWGKSQIETINKNQFVVHFTDYLGHRGQEYTHKCAQSLTVNDEGLITEIKHIDDPKERAQLNQFYLKVGILSK